MLNETIDVRAPGGARTSRLSGAKRPDDAMRRLRWITIFAAIALLLSIVGIAVLIVMPGLGRPAGDAVSILGISVGVIVFSMAVFRRIDMMQREIVKQNEDMRLREKEAEGLYQTALDIASLRDTRETLWSIAQRAREMLGAYGATLCLREKDRAVLAASSGYGKNGGHLVSLALVLTEPADLADEWTVANCPLACESSSARACAALRVGGVQIGELCVSRNGQQPFGERQSDLLAGLADLAAIAVENGRLLEKERYVAVLEERERLSREMHDSLAQSLAYLHLKAQTTLKILDQQDFGRAGHELRELASQAHEAFVDVREGILDLRETVSAGTDFAQTLRTYLRKFNQQTGLVVELDVVDPPIPRLGPGAEVQLLRVIQEALANVRKHANTGRARIRITRGERLLTVAIEDDGQGFDPAAMSDDGRSFGLATMRERVERAGGDFKIESAPGGGTKVEAVFPASEV